MTARQPGKRVLVGGVLALVLALVCSLGPVAAHAKDDVAPWTYAYAGLDHFYNLEYQEAISDFQQAIKGDPDNPYFYNFLANTYLFQELRRVGALEGNLYDASNSFLQKKKPEPDPAVIQKMKENLAKAREICQARLEKNPNDVEALYVLGATYGVEGNYDFTILKSWYEALGAGNKANDLHEKVLKLDPNYQDAKLIPGVYQYIVGSIPGGVKWLAFLFGYHGSKQKGVRLLQAAMTKGKLTTSDAAFLLAIIYTREKHYDYTRKLLHSLSQFYPRNPLLPLEISRSYVREGKPKEALKHYAAVAKDMEDGKPGYDKLPRERVWYQVGVLAQQQGDYKQALDAFAKVMNGNSDEDDAVVLKAQSGLRRGEIYMAQNHPQLARAEYEKVAAMPDDQARHDAEERLRVLKASSP